MFPPQVYYSMSLKSENPWLLRHPTVNISNDGEVPKVESGEEGYLHFVHAKALAASSMGVYSCMSTSILEELQSSLIVNCAATLP